MPVTHLFGVGGRSLLDEVALGDAYRRRVDSLLGLIDAFDDEIEVFAAVVAEILEDHRGDQAIQAIQGVGPVMAAIFVAEIGDVTRFPDARDLCSWAGLTPRTASLTPCVSRGHITKMASGAAGPPGAGPLLSGGDRDDHRWARYPSSPAHIRLRGHDHRGGRHRPDRS